MASIKKEITSKGETRYAVRYRDLNRRSREKWFRRMADAKAFKSQVEADLYRGTWTDPRGGEITLDAWSEIWMKSKSHLAPKTLAGYRSLLDLHVLQELGRRSLSSLGPEDVGAWVSGMNAKRLSPSRVRQAYRVLSGMLQLAHSYDRISRNPAAVDGVKRLVPRPREAEMRFLTSEEVVELSISVPQEYSALILVLGIAGLRFGEAVALRRRRVDLLHNRIHVSESATEVDGKLIFGQTKSGKDRWVDIPSFVTESLNVRMKDVDIANDSLIFTTPEGRPLRNSNFRNRIWKPSLEAVGIDPKTRLHDLRHSAVSIMILNGAPITLVQRQVGHASIVTTQRYAHLYPSQGVELSERIDQSLRSGGAGVGLNEATVIPLPV